MRYDGANHSGGLITDAVVAIDLRLRGIRGSLRVGGAP